MSEAPDQICHWCGGSNLSWFFHLDIYPDARLNRLSLQDVRAHYEQTCNECYATARTLNATDPLVLGVLRTIAPLDRKALNL